jgi:hypothetical protein
MNVLAVYRTLLRLYPAEYFREYAAEMTWVFEQAKEDTRAKKLTARMLFCAHEICGVIGGATRQRLFGCWDSNSSRRFNMEFRFPRSTVFLMWVILAGVLLAIAEAKNIALPYGPTETRSVWSMLPWFIVVSAVLVCCATAITWGILFALKRTGMHRLENMQIGMHSAESRRDR